MGSRAALVVLATYIAVVAAQVPQYGQVYGLDGTYYGVQSPYGQGHCSFQFSNSYNLSWATGIYAPIALNAPQYADSTPCGMCVQYRGTGEGLGLVPIQTNEWRYGLISDECPECLAGSLDLAINGDGRWKVEWTPVQCNVGTSNFVYSLQGSNPYYLKLAITNTRVPVASVSLDGVPMTKSIDNYWLASASSAPGFAFPIPITITSLLGDTVSDSIPAGLPFPDGVAPGNAQFPINCNIASVQAGGSLPLSGQPSSSAGLEGCPSATPQAAASPPPAEAAPQSPPPAVAPPESPVPAASPPPPVTPTPTTPATVDPPAVPEAQAPGLLCNRTIPLGNQCGGEGGQCAIQGDAMDLSNCEDDQWLGACCPEGGVCKRLQRFIWQCASLDAAGTTYPVQQGTIPAMGQCGGLGTCPTNLCGDRQWANTSCAGGSTCTRYDRNFWQCRPQPFSTPAPKATYLPNPLPVAG